MRSWHLAQANVGRMRAPLADPVMAGFVGQLQHINDVADRSHGFVWRLQTPDGDATAIRAFDDDRILFNMSVWESVEALSHYVYQSDHLGPLRDRKQWFERMDSPAMVLWWIESGQEPTVADAKAKLEQLAREGPTSEAFTFTKTFPAPASRDA